MRSQYGRVSLVVLALAVGMLAVGAAFADDAEYVGNSKCKMCHNKKSAGQQWNKWKEAKHSGAFTTLSTDAAKATAERAGLATPPAESAECLQCHVTGHDLDVAALKQEDGVQCESCHGPASLHLVFGKKAMTNKEAAATMDTDIVRPDATVCAKCHNDKNPNDPGDFDFDERYAMIDHSKPAE